MKDKIVWGLLFSVPTIFILYIICSIYDAHNTYSSEEYCIVESKSSHYSNLIE